MVEIITEDVTMPLLSQKRFQRYLIGNKWAVEDTGGNGIVYKGKFEEASLICHNLNKKFYRDKKSNQLKFTDMSAVENKDSNTEVSQPKRQLTFGEKLVGLNFNPSNDDAVSKAKRLCADLADLTHAEMYKGQNEISELQSRLYDHTIGEILNAQMNVVKVLTLKY